MERRRGLEGGGREGETGREGRKGGRKEEREREQGREGEPKQHGQSPVKKTYTVWHPES